MSARHGRDLFELWTEVSEAEPNPFGPVLRIRVASPRTAKNLRHELYRLRRRIQEKAKEGLTPDDERWGKSPWDNFVIRWPINTPELHFYQEETSHEWEVIEEEEGPALPEEILTASRPSRRGKKKKEISLPK